MGTRRIVVVGPEQYCHPCGVLAAEAYDNVVTLSAVRVSGTAAFDISAIAPYSPEEWSAFAAVGSELLNLSRLSLMSQLVAAGYRLAALVSARACLASDMVRERNVLIGAGAIVGYASVIRHNAVMGAGAILGSGVHIGHSVWIGAGAILGDRVRIGEGTIIGAGAIVAEGVSVGAQCEVSVGQVCHRDIPARTLSSPAFDDVARVYPQRA